MSFENRSYANNQRNSGAAKSARPVRTLLVTVLATAILYGVAIATGATSINLGLDRLDTSIFKALIEQFGGGPVGLNTLAMAVGEERETVESVAEPFLVRSGFMVRSPRGRAATALAWKHLGKTPPAQSLGLFDSPEFQA